MKTIEDLQIQINEERLLVFIETGPQTNIYNQVFLNNKQFKKVSDAVIETSRMGEDLKPEMEEISIQTSTEEYFLPDLQSIN